MSSALELFLEELARLANKYRNYYEELSESIFMRPCLTSQDHSQKTDALNVSSECAQTIDQIENLACQQIRETIDKINIIQTHTSHS